MKIQIIEDDINIASSLRSKLAVHDISVMLNNGTADIKDIILEIKREKPDFIILDLVLPEVSGFELLNSIKADEDIFLIPVFVFSDMSDADVRARCHNLGADYYFLKEELNTDEFVSKILKTIKNRNKILNS